MMQHDHSQPSTSRRLRPMRLVYSDDHGKWKIDPETIDFIDRVKGPLAVVSVCGYGYHTKCFLLNQLVGKSSGVQVSCTHLPCTKGIWMWGAPLKRVALDGTEFNLLLLDCEGMDMYNSTGTNCCQLFSLVILLSSLVIYSQISDINEDALDCLIHATEFSKHIFQKSSREKDPVLELGTISPVLVWLMDSDLKKGNAKITLHDYLELALRPLIGSGEDVAAKNKVRASIRGFYPDRECFTLVRSLTNETGLENLAELPPEFRSSVDALMKFVFERAKSKQVEGITMTGTVFSHLLKSFLDPINDGAAITIFSSWQDYKRSLSSEEDLVCRNAIENMEQKLQESCLVADANIEDVMMVLDGLQSKYEASVNGPEKWQKLSSFLRQSLQGPVLQHAKKLLDKVSSEKSALLLKCRSVEDKMDSLNKKLEASEKLKNEYKKHYEDAIIDLKKLSDHFKSRITDLESKCHILEERCSSSLELLDSTTQKSLEWKRLYEETFTKKEAVNHHNNRETKALLSRIKEAEAKAVAAMQQAQTALKERDEWRNKFDTAAREVEASRQNAATVQDSSAEKAKLREETLMGEYSSILAQKDEEIKDKGAKLAEAGQKLRTLTSDFLDSQTTIKYLESEVSALKLQLKESDDRYQCVRAATQTLERGSEIMIQERSQLEQSLLSNPDLYEKACEKVCEMCKTATEKIKVANELVQSARSVVKAARNKNSEAREVTKERPVEIEGLQRHIAILEKQKTDLEGEVEKYRASEGLATSKITSLEAAVKQKDQEIESMKIKDDPLFSSSQFFDGLESDFGGLPFDQMQLHQSDIDFSNLESPSAPSSDFGFNSTPKSHSLGKRWWQRTSTGDEDLASATRKRKTASTLERCSETESTDLVGNANEHGSVEVHNAYMKLTVPKLREALIGHGFEAELRALKNPRKNQILALYKKLILKE